MLSSNHKQDFEAKLNRNADTSIKRQVFYSIGFLSTPEKHKCSAPFIAQTELKKPKNMKLLGEVLGKDRIEELYYLGEARLKIEGEMSWMKGENLSHQKKIHYDDSTGIGAEPNKSKREEDDLRLENTLTAMLALALARNPKSRSGNGKGTIYDSERHSLRRQRWRWRRTRRVEVRPGLKIRRPNEIKIHDKTHGLLLILQADKTTTANAVGAALICAEPGGLGAHTERGMVPINSMDNLFENPVFNAVSRNGLRGNGEMCRHETSKKDGASHSA